MSRFQIALASLFLLPAGCFGSAVIYTSRAAFNLAAPYAGATEDFEDAAIAPGAVLSTASPLDSLTNNSIFATGSIMTGLRLSSSGGFYVSNGFFSSPTIAVYTANERTPLTISFPNGGVTALGLDLYSSFSEGPASPIAAYDADGNLIAQTDIAMFASGVFFGIVSTTPIDHLIYTVSDSSTLIGVDDITFGSDVTATPEPAAMLLTAAGLLALAARRITL